MARSWRTLSMMSGRRTLTATTSPSRSSARCTCATEAAATGSSSKRRKHLVQRAAELGLDQGPHGRRGKRRNAVLQCGQLLDQRPRQEIGARRRDLADLDERRAELGAQPYQRDPGGARRRVRSPHRQPMADRRRPRRARRRQRSATNGGNRSSTEGANHMLWAKGKGVGAKTKGKRQKSKGNRVR
jgi:hypothetical protein